MKAHIVVTKEPILDVYHFENENLYGQDFYAYVESRIEPTESLHNDLWLILEAARFHAQRMLETGAHLQKTNEAFTGNEYVHGGKRIIDAANAISKMLTYNLIQEDAES